MSLLDSIDAFDTDTVTVTRTPAGSYVQGLYVPGTSVTFTVTISIQPATGLARVVGGKDTRFLESGETTYDVRQFFSRVALLPRTADQDPDLIAFEGADWTVIRAEPWTYSGETFYRCVMTRTTRGAA